MEVKINPTFVREGEVFRLLGDRNRLAAIAGTEIQFDIDSTIEWMLS